MSINASLLPRLPRNFSQHLRIRGEFFQKRQQALDCFSWAVPCQTAANQLEGTVALVTGASSGIGEATGLALARQGAAVALVARRAERLESLAGRVQESGGTALTITADVMTSRGARPTLQASTATTICTRLIAPTRVPLIRCSASMS